MFMTSPWQTLFFVIFIVVNLIVRKGIGVKFCPVIAMSVSGLNSNKVRAGADIWTSVLL